MQGNEVPFIKIDSSIVSLKLLVEYGYLPNTLITNPSLCVMVIQRNVALAFPSSLLLISKPFGKYLFLTSDPFI